MADVDELRRRHEQAEQAARDALNALRMAEQEDAARRHQAELDAMTPAQRAARAIIDKACADPEVWATHGMPGERKLGWLEREIAAAIDAAANS